MRRAVLAVFVLFMVARPVAASPIAGGFLSFDVFIPAGSGPGTNSFDMFNLTGSTYGPPAGSIYIATSVTLDDAVLTVFPSSGSPQIFDLGNVGPGELLDSEGDPVVQFPSNVEFASATLTATLSQTDLTLSDGSTFNAAPSLSVNLTASSGGTLRPGVDLALIEVEPASLTTPEPGAAVLLGSGLLLMIGLAMCRGSLRRRARI